MTRKNIDGERACKHCQQTFIWSHLHRTFCSLDCTDTYYKATARARQVAKVNRTKNCSWCSKTFTAEYRSASKYCSVACKLEFTKSRRKPNRLQNNICMTCSKTFKHKNQKLYCSPECYEKKLVSNREGYEKTRKAQRNQRERSAVGLSIFEINTLRTQWINDERTCIYCGGFPDTVDHITPLVRGGTNEIFNLAPCCKSCNSSKGSRLIHEWVESKVQAS